MTICIKNTLRAAMVAGICLGLSACTMAGAKKDAALPSLASAFKDPVYVDAAQIVVENRYDPLANARDVSSTFPTPPDVALKQYAETNIRSAGGQGIFHFVIQDAAVFQESRQSDVEMARWIGVDNREKYVAKIRIGLYRDTGYQSSSAPAGAELKAERSITMPVGLSLDERDNRIQAFMIELLRDVDQAVRESLVNTLRLSTVEPAPSPGPRPVEPVEITPFNGPVPTASSLPKAR